MTPGWDLQLALGGDAGVVYRLGLVYTDNRGSQKGRPSQTSQNSWARLQGTVLSRWFLIADRDITLLQYAR